MTTIDEDPFGLARQAAGTIGQLSGVPSHDIALVLGSGWGEAADVLGEVVWSAPATTVAGFRSPALTGHAGTLRSIRLEGPSGPAHALVIGARTHLYEGHGVRSVVHGVRTAAAAGCRTIILTNGCGSILPENPPGTPVLIRDHLNLQATSPVEGATFVDLTDLYAARLREVARSVEPSLTDAVYAGFTGPHFETPAEVAMARTLGAGLVGMSTVLEAIAAREAGMEVLGLSLVTNLAAGIGPSGLDHAEVLAVGQVASGRLGQLLADVTRAVVAS